jgi:hypothetical protein
MYGLALRSLYPGEESPPRWPLHRRLRGFQNPPGRAAEETDFFPVLGLGHRTVQPVCGIGERLLLFCVYWSGVIVYVGASGCMSFKVARYYNSEIITALTIQ